MEVDVLSSYRGGAVSWVQRRQKGRKQCEFFGRMSALKNLSIVVSRGSSYLHELSLEFPGLKDLVEYLLRGISQSVAIQWSFKEMFRAEPDPSCSSAEVLRILAEELKDVRGTNRCSRTYPPSRAHRHPLRLRIEHYDPRVHRIRNLTASCASSALVWTSAQILRFTRCEPREPRWTSK